MFNIIPKSIIELHELFKSNGKKLFVVGGAVRDFITNEIPKDFDLATDALPEEVIKIVKDNYRFNEQGKAFGVVVVYTEDEPMGMEVATFRQDISKGRNPKVNLGVTIEEDVKRRDLTFNSLFYDIDKKEIIDLVGGVDDLENGITRTVGNPIERFEEDSLRILRTFRFNTRYRNELDLNLKKAIHKRNNLSNVNPNTGLLERISQERIWEEIKKTFSQVGDFNSYLNLFTVFGMWGEIFPNANINTDLIDSDNFTIIMANIFIDEDFNNKLNRDKLVHNYKIESNTASIIIFLNQIFELNVDSVFDIYKKRKQLKITDELLTEWFTINSLIGLPIFKKFIDYRPSVSAQKLMEEGFSGPELGKEIKKRESEKFKQKLK